MPKILRVGQSRPSSSWGAAARATEPFHRDRKAERKNGKRFPPNKAYLVDGGGAYLVDSGGAYLVDGGDKLKEAILMDADAKYSSGKSFTRFALV
jgi:hypothetical protein